MDVNKEIDKKCNCCDRIFSSGADLLKNTTRWRISDTGDLYFNCSCNSTLMLPKGKFPWFNPTDNLSEEAKHILNKLEQNKQKFPRIPKVVLEFEQLLESEVATSKQLADCLIRDPFFSIKIIGVANQRKKRSGEDIKDLAHAVTVLGRETLRSLVNVAAAEYILPKTKLYTANIIWTDMFLTGTACVKINSLFKHKVFKMSEDEAFLIGSLCNIGKLVGSVFFPEETDAVYLFSQASGGAISWQEAEVIKAANLHTVLGEIAGVFWGFPNFVLMHIGHHHHDYDESFEMLDYLRNNILKMALCTNKVVQGISAKKVLDEMGELAELLDFTNSAVIEILDFTRSRYEEIKEKTKSM